ncbi:hypothetical protein BH10PAT1_BH10PAT1_3360 [soil metagenome]
MIILTVKNPFVRIGSIIFVAFLVLSIPVLVWGLLTGNFQLRGRAASGEPPITPVPVITTPTPNIFPTPTPNSGPTNPISWNTGYVSLSASDFYISIGGGQHFNVNNVQNLDVRSDPENSSYTTLEATWHETNGVEMRLYMYFAKDSNNNWYVSQVRTYNGQLNGDWIFYPGFPGSGNQGPLNQSSFDLIATGGSGVGQIHFDNLSLQPFLVSPTPSPTPVPPTPSPSPCVRTTPTLNLTPISQSGVAGQKLTYQVYFKDNDQNCPVTNFNFVPVVPAGWSYQMSPVQVAFSNGGSLGATLDITSSKQAIPGNYQMVLKANSSFPENSQQTLSIYQINSPTPAPTLTPKPTSIPAPNHAPVIDTHGIYFTKLNKSFKLNITGYDTDQKDNLNMTITNLPKGMTQGSCSSKTANNIKSVNCSISGNPSQNGIYLVNIKLSDGKTTSTGNIVLLVYKLF